MTDDILQYESKIWNTADLLRGCGIKESDWPAFMMPFFALMMIESRLVRELDQLTTTHGADFIANLSPADRYLLAKGDTQGYNEYIFTQRYTLKDICRNDKSFEVDFEAYLTHFDGETQDLLGVETSAGKKYLDIRGVIAKLKAKGILFSYTSEWSEIDLKPFDNAEITTLEEHIKRRWADISAETAGEQYTPGDIISLIADIIATKITETDTLLRIYDCTCGGGNLLFGVEDRINHKFKRLTETYGQDWNDALYALAKIESRFRPDAHIYHGNTLTDDQFRGQTFDVVVANPPYGVSWKGYRADIKRDRTDRFHYLPAVSDGQLLFMQHLVAKMNETGVGVVVHNGSTLFSGDAGSAESNIRKWLLDNDIVEALIQLPTDEFFNTGIHTYLWVLNKNKPAPRRDKVMLLDASTKCSPLKKSRGAKRKQVDAAHRAEIVAALRDFSPTDFARIFSKTHFYFNKQALLLTNLDAAGRTFASQLKPDQTSRKLKPTRLTNGQHTFTTFTITTCPPTYATLRHYYDAAVKPALAAFDARTQAVQVETKGGTYRYDPTEETLILEKAGQPPQALGCGTIVAKASFKRATKTRPAAITLRVALTPDTTKDYEIIPYHPDAATNQAAIDAFMAGYITRPFTYLDNVVGVALNFNKIFYTPQPLRPVPEILREIETLNHTLQTLEATFLED